jgi:hypothetical protein
MPVSQLTEYARIEYGALRHIFHELHKEAHERQCASHVPMTIFQSVGFKDRIYVIIAHVL